MLQNYTEQQLALMSEKDLRDLINNYQNTLGAVTKVVGYYTICIDGEEVLVDIKEKNRPDEYGSGMDMSLLNNPHIDFYEISENALYTEDVHPVHEIVSVLHSLGFVQK